MTYHANLGGNLEKRKEAEQHRVFGQVKGESENVPRTKQVVRGGGVGREGDQVEEGRDKRGKGMEEGKGREEGKTRGEQRSGER